MIDIHWHIDVNLLYMEAVDAENGLTLGRHVENLPFVNYNRDSGFFKAEDEYRAEWPEITQALNDFANYYRDKPLYYGA